MQGEISARLIKLAERSSTGKLSGSLLLAQLEELADQLRNQIEGTKTREAGKLSNLINVYNFVDKENYISFDIDSVLPNRSAKDTGEIRDAVYAAVRMSRNYQKYGHRTAVLVTEYRYRTKNGKCPKDADNIQIKGVIDGAFKALNLDDNGDFMCFGVRINGIERDQVEYTNVLLVHEDNLIINNTKGVINYV